MLDYAFLDQTSDVDELRAVLASLVSGENGKFPHLEDAFRNKLIKLLPEKEQQMIATIKSQATAKDSSKEMTDLQSWIEEVQVKPPNESNEQHHKATTSLLCSIPIRSTSHIQQIIQTALSENAATASNASTQKSEGPASKPLIRKEKLSTKDYFEAWDKFSEDDSDDETLKPELVEARRNRDRDAELCELQRQIANNELKISERQFLSEREREKGNEHFKSREDEDAYHSYTKSILLNPSNAKSLANRAAVSLRFGKEEEAILDCTKAIGIDPTYTKAIARRGMTLHRLERYNEAAADFKMCHSLEPDSGYSRMMLQSEEKQREKNQIMTRLTIEECESEVEDDEASIIEEVFTPGVLSDSEHHSTTKTIESTAPKMSGHNSDESWQKISIVEVSESDEDSQDDRESSLLRRVEITCEDEIVEEKMKRRNHDSSALCF